MHYLRLFRHRKFVIGLLCLALGFLSVQGLLALFVVQLQVLMGYSSSLAGMRLHSYNPLWCAADRNHARSGQTGCVQFLASLNAAGFAATFTGSDSSMTHSRTIRSFGRWSSKASSSVFLHATDGLTLHGLSGDQMLRAAEVANVF